MPERDAPDDDATVTAASGGRRDRGALEAAVLALFADTAEALTVSEVQARLGGTSAYTTVMTTLARLHRKGALNRQRRGKAFAYTVAAPPQAVEDAIVARRMRELLEGRTDRGEVLTRFVAELDPTDEQLLTRILHQLDHRNQPPDQP
ncbi:BlaI/MecI/CopY family transcriptional regulator [Gandjariella thermophila]|uniref:Putative penicillinase repressor n=1 Tax=Gandjariella thermophila TaxID=1931992 RepID=A0A4D4JE69_9PSEU|nr:BlaI/MecI/CopY family transcriptional regulator [Gandjariella thermophila]GDY33944.1 putative penicillinase repressor [Gandjariella thermophila]